MFLILAHLRLIGKIFKISFRLASEFNYHTMKVGRTEMTGRRGIRRTQLLDDIKEKRQYSYWKLKKEALDHTL
jgi:hypothetical protein